MNVRATRSFRRRALGVPLAVTAAALALGAPACGRGPDRGVGEACVNNGDCRDFCATGSDFPNGFCTTNCFDDRDCPADAICADVMGGICLFPCNGEVESYCASLIDPNYRCDNSDTPDGRVVLICIGN